MTTPAPSAAPAIGVGLGTCMSAVAWIDRHTGEAAVLQNREGKYQTPSAVYFDPDPRQAPLVGEPAEQMLADPERRRGVVLGNGGDLAGARLIALPGRRVEPLDVAAAILDWLRHDAEALHLWPSLQPLARVVIACPSASDRLQRDGLREAGRRAGFEEVAVVDEPVAAGLAYAARAPVAPLRLLVFSLGAATCEVTALTREPHGGYRVVCEPQGLGVGGADFDRRLYDHLDDVAGKLLKLQIGRDGRYDLHMLRACRGWKEVLTGQPKIECLVPLDDNGQSVPMRRMVERETFEGLIRPLVDEAIELTQKVLAAARDAGYPPEVVVLTGGSSLVPLVRRRLTDALTATGPRTVLPTWHLPQMSAAIGAALYTARLWPYVPHRTTRQQRGEDRRPAVEATENAAVSRPEAEATSPSVEQMSSSLIERYLIRTHKEYVKREDNVYVTRLGDGLTKGSIEMALILSRNEGERDYIISFFSDLWVERSDWSRALEVCNEWNQTHRWPKAYLRVTRPDVDTTGRIELETCLPLEKGIHQELLNDVTQKAVERAYRFFAWAREEGGL